MLRGTMVTCKILEGIHNALIIGFGDVMNSTESQLMAENLAANVPSE